MILKNIFRILALFFRYNIINNNIKEISCRKININRKIFLEN